MNPKQTDPVTKMSKTKNDIHATPILFPYDPAEYWEKLRAIIKEEIKLCEKSHSAEVSYQISGLTYKPLFKMAEVCSIFKITRPTVYEWIKHGKLKPFKIRSRVYFLWNDIQKLINNQS